jgi:TonB family protein
MNKGKTICGVLKTIRQQVADANEISYKPAECHHRGECAGTCPACEAEVKYINQQLDLRRQLGKAVVIAGISAGLLSAPAFAAGQKPVKPVPKAKSSVKAAEREKDALVIGSTGAAPAPYQVTPQKMDTTKVFGVVEQMPSFPGGDAALMEFIKKEMVYPAEAKRKGVEGRVIVEFVVERNGRITSAKVVKSIDPLLDREALRIVRKMPRWNPGRQAGQTYRVKYIIPITFRL